MNTLTINLLFSTLVFWIAAKIYLLPRLHELRPRSVLLPILLLHAFRHLGLMFLAPGGTYAGIAPQFAYPAAFGDLVAALLAVAAIAAVALNARAARLLVWVFNVEGTVDLIAAITLATVYGAAAHMGPAYWIPASESGRGKERRAKERRAKERRIKERRAAQRGYLGGSDISR